MENNVIYFSYYEKWKVLKGNKGKRKGLVWVVFEKQSFHDLYMNKLLTVLLLEQALLSVWKQELSKKMEKRMRG